MAPSCSTLAQEQWWGGLGGLPIWEHLHGNCASLRVQTPQAEEQGLHPWPPGRRTWLLGQHLREQGWQGWWALVRGQGTCQHYEGSG